MPRGTRCGLCWHAFISLSSPLFLLEGVRLFCPFRGIVTREKNPKKTKICCHKEKKTSSTLKKASVHYAGLFASPLRVFYSYLFFILEMKEKR